jgi:hypothetical protein
MAPKKQSPAKIGTRLDGFAGLTCRWLTEWRGVLSIESAYPSACNDPSGAWLKASDRHFPDCLGNR